MDNSIEKILQKQLGCLQDAQINGNIMLFMRNESEQVSTEAAAKF